MKSAHIAEMSFFWGAVLLANCTVKQGSVSDSEPTSNTSSNESTVIEPAALRSHSQLLDGGGAERLWQRERCWCFGVTGLERIDDRRDQREQRGG